MQPSLQVIHTIHYTQKISPFELHTGQTPIAAQIIRGLVVVLHISSHLTGAGGDGELPIRQGWHLLLQPENAP